MKYIGVLTEAIVVGIMTILVGYIAGFIMSYGMPIQQECKNWNKNYVMEKSLFLTGFLIHIICQVSGINHWYCRNGVACLN